MHVSYELQHTCGTGRSSRCSTTPSSLLCAVLMQARDPHRYALHDLLAGNHQPWDVVQLVAMMTRMTTGLLAPTMAAMMMWA